MDDDYEDEYEDDKGADDTDDSGTGKVWVAKWYAYRWKFKLQNGDKWIDRVQRAPAQRPIIM